MRRWGSSCHRIHLMRCRCRRCRPVSKQVTLVHGESELGEIRRRCDVGGGLETETGTEMWTFHFAPQEVVRGVSFRVHVKSELFFLFHRDPRLHLNKNSIVFFHFRRSVLFSPFLEVRRRVCVAKLPRRRDTHLRGCLHAPAAE